LISGLDVEETKQNLIEFILLVLTNENESRTRYKIKGNKIEMIGQSCEALTINSVGVFNLVL
jgi:hypothetical protein